MFIVFPLQNNDKKFNFKIKEHRDDHLELLNHIGNYINLKNKNQVITDVAKFLEDEDEDKLDIFKNVLFIMSNRLKKSDHDFIISTREANGNIALCVQSVESLQKTKAAVYICIITNKVI